MCFPPPLSLLNISLSSSLVYCFLACPTSCISLFHFPTPSFHVFPRSFLLLFLFFSFLLSLPSSVCSPALPLPHCLFISSPVRVVSCSLSLSFIFPFSIPLLCSFSTLLSYVSYQLYSQKANNTTKFIYEGDHVYICHQESVLATV